MVTMLTIFGDPWPNLPKPPQFLHFALPFVSS